ncbi:MAG: transcriptional regulator [Candidatus Thorarchaeota archaeon]
MSAGDSKTKRSKRRTWLMPQEVEVWYVLPAIRRELARVMIGKEIPQKQIAQMLGVTEPAVTQYKLNKSKRSRGDQVEIPKDMLPELKKSAEVILRAWEERDEGDWVYEIMTREINRIIEVLRDKGTLCDVHREYCAHVEKECSACKD